MMKIINMKITSVEPKITTFDSFPFPLGPGSSITYMVWLLTELLGRGLALFSSSIVTWDFFTNCALNQELTKSCVRLENWPAEGDQVLLHFFTWIKPRNWLIRNVPTFGVLCSNAILTISWYAYKTLVSALHSVVIS